MQTEWGFTELESDEASIGYRLETGETSPSYKTLPLDLSQAISLVIVSDGILDQKGGAKGLSLGRRRLKKPSRTVSKGRYWFESAGRRLSDACDS